MKMLFFFELNELWWKWNWSGISFNSNNIHSSSIKFELVLYNWIWTKLRENNPILVMTMSMFRVHFVSLFISNWFCCYCCSISLKKIFVWKVIRLMQSKLKTDGDQLKLKNHFLTHILSNTKNYLSCACLCVFDLSYDIIVGEIVKSLSSNEKLS